MYVSPQFFQMFDIDIDEGSIPEKTERGIYVLNRAAMKALNFSSLEEAAVVEDNRKRRDANAPMSNISAVVKDYYNGHLTAGAVPTIYNVSSFGGTRYQIAYPEGRKQDLLNYLKETMKEIYGVEEFTYTFLEDDVKALYKDDQKIASIYNIFALIAIAVSCLGLFGISLFDIRQRYREIAIRKAHGAGMKDLYQLLFKKYLAVLGASFVVAVPIAYYLIHQYTADFVVKAPIGMGIFVLALLLVTVISMGTLYWQIRKAANIDPATVMKSE
jgi:ABC-type antimicrobial peptide transport system permease subunit